MVPFPEPHKPTSETNSNGNGHSRNGTATLHNESLEVISTSQLEPEVNAVASQPVEVTEPHPPTTSNQRMWRGQGAVVPRRRKRGLSLRNKATALAIALGTLPVIAIGTTAYYLTNKGFAQEITNAQQETTQLFADKAGDFMAERYGDIQTISAVPIFTDPQLRSQSSTQQKQEILDTYIRNYNVYDQIALFDLQGNPVVQSQGAALPNISKELYFSQVTKNPRAIISLPEKSQSTGKLVINLAAPIIDKVTGKVVNVIYARMPVELLQKSLVASGLEGEDFYVLDAAGDAFVATKPEYLGQGFRKSFPGLAKPLITRKSGSHITIDQNSNSEKLVTYTPLPEGSGLPELYWQTVLLKDTATAFAVERNLLTTLIAGTIITTLIVSAIAAYLANRGTRPIVKAADTVEKLGQGQLDQRLRVTGSDELAILGDNINSMASRLQTLLNQQTQEAERIRLVKDITLRLGQYPQVQEIFNVAVAEIRTALSTDRVVVYSFDTNWKGTVIAESVAESFPKALGAKIDDPCFAKGYVERYRSGRVQATNDIYNAGLTECHLKQLAQFEVKANLVAPIVQAGQLLGLLIAHQCSAPRAWQQGEIDLFAQLATQVGYALDRAKLLEQQKAAKELLQRRALELLMEVDPVSKGDLTIRASVTEDEIGTIADSYNSTISSLRKIVDTVQSAATQVASTTTTNETAVAELSTEALRQAQEINTAVERIQQMSASIQAVADKAATAQLAVQQANATVAASDAAMNRTVNGMEILRDTVSQTEAKVKHLGESSQKISKVVSLIGRFAAQTNLLALKASIEAARAGEEGRGFAVLADEVRLLASQSAQATSEIEKLVLAIQVETKEVVSAMKAGSDQVVASTNLVDETRATLTNITKVSAQIDELVSAIANATIVQTQASTAVTDKMSDVAAIADKTSSEANNVSATFQQLLALAQELQTSVAQFKVS